MTAIRRPYLSMTSPKRSIPRTSPIKIELDSLVLISGVSCLGYLQVLARTRQSMIINLQLSHDTLHITHNLDIVPIREESNTLDKNIHHWSFGLAWVGSFDFRSSWRDCCLSNIQLLRILLGHCYFVSVCHTQATSLQDEKNSFSEVFALVLYLITIIHASGISSRSPTRSKSGRLQACFSRPTLLFDNEIPIEKLSNIFANLVNFRPRVRRLGISGCRFGVKNLRLSRVDLHADQFHPRGSR